METLSFRQKQVLRSTVRHYVDTIEPVSSKTLVERFGLKASAATIRTAMGALEQRGLLTQPHTSSGRIPSQRGYRHYVDCLLPPPAATINHLEHELTNLGLQWAALDDLLVHLAKRLTDFTGLMSLIAKPKKLKHGLQDIRLVKSGTRLLVMLVKTSDQATLLNIQLPHDTNLELEGLEAWTQDQLERSNDGFINWSNLPSHLNLSGSFLKEAIQNHKQAPTNTEEIVITRGISQLASQPEFKESNSFRPFLELMDSQPSAVVPKLTKSSNSVWIGAEHPESALKHFSVVQAAYKSSTNGIGHVALIGPMRMAYSTAIAAVTHVAKHLERLLN